MSRVPDFILSCARLAALTGEELAARNALSSFSRSRMRYLTGSSACASSGSVKRGVMCCGQFKPEQDRAVDEHIDLADRVGALPDSTLVATKVGEIRRVVSAPKSGAEKKK
jgi:hypothetical protein